jgi:hypothetical protein
MLAEWKADTCNSSLTTDQLEDDQQQTTTWI